MLPHRSLRTRSACLLLALFLIVVVGLFGLPKDTYFPFFALEPVTCLRVPVRSPVSFESLVLPAPSPHNSLQLAQLWQRLTDIYHAHPPTPHCIIRPILSGPSNINDFTLEQANAAFKLNPKQALRTRESQQRVLELLPDYSSFGTLFQGRGIVILAGGRFSSVATVSIAILRRSHGSSLPVEVWMPHDTEDDVLWIDDMRNLGVSIRYLSEYAPMGSLLDWVNPMAWAKKQRPWNPYQWKIMALLFSSFEEILFLDADSVPAVKSERIFETEAYHSTGAVIWPDYWPKVTSSVLPYLVGLSNSPSDLWWHKPTAESGQMLGNEKHHWQVSSSRNPSPTVHSSLQEFAPSLLLQLPRTGVLVHRLGRECARLGRQGDLPFGSDGDQRILLHGSREGENDRTLQSDLVRRQRSTHARTYRRGDRD